MEIPLRKSSSFIPTPWSHRFSPRPVAPSRLLLNYIFHLHDHFFHDRLTSLHKAILLLGARQVGKTTLLYALENRLARQGKSIRYLNCDLEEERQAINRHMSLRAVRCASGQRSSLLLQIMDCFVFIKTTFVKPVRLLSNPEEIVAHLSQLEHLCYNCSDGFW